MSERLKFFFAVCCYYSGLVALARCWMRRSKQRLIILNYHRASGGNLRRHLLYLRRHYRLMHLEDALEELYASEHPAQEGDRRTPLVLTFDDGYQDNYTHAFALACELHVPITIFLVPGYIDSGYPFPWLEGQRLAFLTQKRNVLVEGHCYNLKDAKKRHLLAQVIDKRLLNAPSISEREAFLTEIYHTLGVPRSLHTEEEPTIPLTWQEVYEMEASGWVSFGAHTMHHPMLACLKDSTETHYEIEACRTFLEQKLGHPIRTFAYPFGQPEQVGDEAPQVAKQAGYKWVVTTVYGINTPQTNPHQLHRIYGDVSRHWLVMATQVSGLLHYIMVQVLKK